MNIFAIKQYFARKHIAASFAAVIAAMACSPVPVLAADLQLAFNAHENKIPSFSIAPDSAVPERLAHSKYTVDDMCRKISGKLSSVRLGDCQGKGLDYAGGSSVNGLPIIVKEYPPTEEKTPLSRVLVIGGIHGDEYSSVSIVFKWMNILNEHHSGMFHWKMVPVMNPDGLLRKKSQRMNDRGVDLNRNFPTPNWHAESHKYWIHKTKRNPRRYPGPAPLSEPESQWLAEYIDDFKPDVIVSIHAPFGILDFDGPRSAPNKFGKLHLRLLGTYPGSLGNYAGKHQELPVVTVELPYAGIMPPHSEITNIWIDLISWLRKNADESLQQASQKTEIENPQIESTQLESSQIESSQVESSQVESSQVESSQVENSQVDRLQLENTQLEEDVRLEDQQALSFTYSDPS
ncbi:MAG: M14 family murein peptide amidase A [Gammaproteobacteria bacterium]|nr:M14 family murein peptide amidase A [Gammaproteobacteria bacterium]